MVTTLNQVRDLAKKIEENPNAPLTENLDLSKIRIPSQSYLGELNVYLRKVAAAQKFKGKVSILVGEAQTPWSSMNIL